MSGRTKNIVCYFTSWSTYRPGNGKYTVANVNPQLCTHIIYSFIGLNQDGTVKEMDSTDVISELVALKKQNKNLKVLVAMGGWNEGSAKYSVMAASESKRKNMVSSVLQFLQKFKLDGFDLDWEYPCQREGSSPKDKVNFIALLKELKTAFEDKGLLLSVAVAGSVQSIDTSYDVPQVSRYCDLINVMSYDIHGSYDGFVGHNAPLYASPLDKDKGYPNHNVAAGIQYWIDKGASPEKLNMGIATYGRSFSLTNPSNSGLYAETNSPGNQGPYTGEAGMLGYNEVLEHCRNWNYEWDDDQKVPHKVYGNQWVGYDDEKSIKHKVEFAASKGLGGIMVWTLDTDDFHNGYPLLRTIKSAL